MKKSILLFMSILLFVFSCTQPVANPGAEEVVLNDNADLSALTLSDNLQFRQPFHKDSNYYTLTVQNSQEQVTMTPVLADSKASFSITNNDLVVSNPIALSVGLNNIKVKVTAENGSTTKIYQFNITRQGKNNADLIGIKGITLKEKFESHVLHYTAYVDLTTDSVTITAELSDPNASYRINYKSSGPATINLNKGDNYINIQVIAEDGRTNRNYNIVITKWDGSDATLAGIGGLTLNEQFASDLFAYTATVSPATETVTLNIVPTNSHASYILKKGGVEITNPLTLDYGSNPIDLIITSKDGKKSLTYSFNITRAFMIEDFETGDFSRNPWAFNNEGKLAIITSTNGSKMAKLYSTRDYSSAYESNLELALTVTEETTIQFYYSYNHSGYTNSSFFFYINDVMKIRNSNDAAKTVSYILKPGDHVLKWQLRPGSGDILYLDNLQNIGGKVKIDNVPPKHLRLSTYTATMVRTYWQAVTGVEYYNIYRASTADGPYQKVNTANISSPSYDDKGLTPLTKYFYKVTAIVNGVESQKSSSLECTTRALPLAPAGLKAATVWDGSVTLSWEYASGSGYKIYRASSLNGDYTHVKSVSSSLTYDYTDTGLTPLTVYYYKIASYNQYDDSLLSAAIEIRTAPIVPQNIVSSSTNDSITLKWEPSPSALSYRVYRSLTIDGNYEQISPADHSSTIFTDPARVADTAYYYRLTALEGAKESSMSEPLKAFTALPTLLNLKVDSQMINGVSLSWDRSNYADKYELLRADTINGPYLKVYNKFPIISPKYTDTGLEQNKTYFYKVVALNNRGASSNPSAPVEATTGVNSTLGVPTGLTITKYYSNGFNLKWDALPGATGYSLYYSSTGIDGPYQLYDYYTSPAGYMNNMSKLLSPNSTYHFKVSGYDANGEGAQSNYLEGKTLPPLETPTGLSRQTVSRDQITISWYSVARASTYLVYMSYSANGAYSQVGDSSTSSFTHSRSFSPGTTYYYKVKALGGNYEQSELSSEYVAAKVPDEITSPENFRATNVTSSSITLSWTPPVGANGGDIYVLENGNYRAIGGSSANFFTYHSVSPQTSYRFKLIATDHAGNQLGSAVYTSVTTR